jgi:transcriptional regulator with XRE-family HTH domain
MPSEKNSFIPFLKELIRRRKCKPSHLAAGIGVSHPTVSRWLSGQVMPNYSSCRKLAEYSGIPLENILAFVGYMPPETDVRHPNWPEFREYAQEMYFDVLDDDLISMIEELIERKRKKINYARENMILNNTYTSVG